MADHPSSEQLAEEFIRQAGQELDDALSKIAHCIDQLNENQLWWRPAESMNSVANLILHLGGNVRQWIIAGVGNQQDTRNRPAEFSQREPIAKGQLKLDLQKTIQQAHQVLAQVSPAELLRVRRVQGFDVTALQAIVESVAHFRGHTQEIVHLTRQQLGGQYKFDFVPSSPEQGAPPE